MKTTRSGLSSLALLLGVLAVLLLTAAPNVFASAEDHVDDGLAVSKAWIGQIDAAQYDESYSAASGEMHDKVPQDRWATVLKAIRVPWGPVVSRHQLSHVYKPDGFEGTEGEFLVITYDTAFEKMPNAVELVVLRWEDGKWRGAGYNAGPKAPPEEAGQPDQYTSTTETQTMEHVKPQPQAQ